MIRVWLVENDHNELYLARRGGPYIWTNDPGQAEHFEREIEAVNAVVSRLNGRGRVVAVELPMAAA